MNEPYQPANGTEGEFFKGQFCYRCRKNTFSEETG